MPLASSLMLVPQFLSMGSDFPKTLTFQQEFELS